jgi:O-antigen ligase
MGPSAWTSVPTLDRGLAQNMPVLAALLSSTLIASAAYTLAGGIGYLTVGLMIVLLALDKRILTDGQAGFPAWPLVGCCVFNALFMLHGLGSGVDGRTLVQHFMSLGIFILSFTAWRGALSGPDGVYRYVPLVAMAGLLTLAILLSGQIAEMAGLIDRRNLGVSQEDANYVFRPGGFLNPNMTAAIAVVVLFAVCESRTSRLGWITYCCAILALCIVTLTQSRTLIAALGGYLCLVGIRQPRLFLIMPLALILAFAIAGGVAFDAVTALIERITGRFDGSLASDVSNAERLHVLTEAVQAANHSPLLGNGYMYLVEIAGVSTHNQVAEMMVNFGALGLLCSIGLFTVLYLPASLSAFVFCMLPTLMFSHNFFDSSPFQASLGMALAVDSLKRASSSR